MKLIDFTNYRDGSLHKAKSSITPIKKDIEKRLKLVYLDPKQTLQQLGGKEIIR